MYRYNINKAKEMIKNSVAVYLEKDDEGYVMEEVNRLPFYLVGAPGIGKTQMAEQIADELGIGFVSCSITHHSRNTVLGLPVITDVKVEDEEKKFTEYTMSEIIGKVYEQVAQGHKEGILLIDEFSCMADNLVAPMLAFLQTKNISSHKLPEGWVLILASNPPEYNKNARKFDVAIMDRVRLINIDFDEEEFLNYAKEHNFNSYIISFLEKQPNYMYAVSNDKKEEEIVTTRGWENLSYALDGFKKLNVKVSEEMIFQFIKSERIAKQFFKYYDSSINRARIGMFDKILSGEDIEGIASKCAKKKSSEKTNLVIELANTIMEDCESFVEDLKFYNMMDERYRNYKEDCSDFGSGNTIETSLRNRMDNNNVYTFDDLPEPTDNEKKAIAEILLMFKTLVALGGKDDDESCLEAYKEWLDEYCENMKKAEQEDSRKISNVINFTKLVAGDDVYIIDNLIAMLSSNLGVLEVVSRCKNEDYIKVCKSLKDKNKKVS